MLEEKNASSKELQPWMCAFRTPAARPVLRSDGHRKFLFALAQVSLFSLSARGRHKGLRAKNAHDHPLWLFFQGAVRTSIIPTPALLSALCALSTLENTSDARSTPNNIALYV